MFTAFTDVVVVCVYLLDNCAGVDGVARCKVFAVRPTPKQTCGRAGHAAVCCK